MLKRAIGVLLVIALFIACAKKENAEQTLLPEGVITASVDSLLLAPEKYLDQTVQVNGLVSHVCRHTGKKLFIAGQAPEQLIKVVTGENMPQFAIELEGSRVQVQGKFVQEVVAVTPEGAVAIETKGIDCETDSLATFSIICTLLKKVN